MAHERVDADAKKVRHARNNGDGWRRVRPDAFSESDAGERDHCSEWEPSHECRDHLQIFRFRNVEEAEGGYNRDEDGQHDSVKRKKMASQILYLISLNAITINILLGPKCKSQSKIHFVLEGYDTE